MALAVASLFVGKYPLSIEQLLAGNKMQWQVFLTLRLSRTVVGVVGGFALGIAGFVYQTVFRNSLASPDIIGVSSGASAGAAAGILFLSGATAVTLSAFAGALLCLSLWLMRWACLQLPGWYAALMMISGVTAVWLTRQKPAALAWTALGIGMDGAGLAMAIAGWPVSAGFALQIHALLCSAALLPYLWALMLRSE